MRAQVYTTARACFFFFLPSHAPLFRRSRTPFTACEAGGVLCSAAYAQTHRNRIPSPPNKGYTTSTIVFSPKRESPKAAAATAILQIRGFFESVHRSCSG